MAITFNEIPDGVLVPVVFTEVDTSFAVQGTPAQQYEALLIGQRLSGGTKPALSVDRITSTDQAKQYYGEGSMLARMAEEFLTANSNTPLTAVPLDDTGSSASGDIDFTGSVATEDGTLYIYLGGIRYQVTVASGDTAADIVDAIVAEVSADGGRAVDVADGGDQVDITARHAGSTGNEIDVRLNYFDGEETPAGVTPVITALAGGTGAPDISTAIAALDPEIQYHIWGHAYPDAANLTLLETELADRFGPIRDIDGSAFVAKRDSFANLVTLGDGRNSPHSSIIGNVNGPSSPWQYAGRVAGVAALAFQIDPARPAQTLELPGLLGPVGSDAFSFSERDMLLKDGIATVKPGPGSVMRIERLVTTYQENGFGSPDPAFRDLTTMRTLSFLRFSFKTRMQLRFSRSKLADDGTRFGPGQAVVTPSLARAEAVALFKEWEADGLVENLDQFKRDLVVERNASDPNRLDCVLPADLINQLRVKAAQFQFRL